MPMFGAWQKAKDLPKWRVTRIAGARGERSVRAASAERRRGDKAGHSGVWNRGARAAEAARGVSCGLRSSPGTRARGGHDGGAAAPGEERWGDVPRLANATTTRTRPFNYLIQEAYAGVD